MRLKVIAPCKIPQTASIAANESIKLITGINNKLVSRTKKNVKHFLRGKKRDVEEMEKMLSPLIRAQVDACQHFSINAAAAIRKLKKKKDEWRAILVVILCEHKKSLISSIA